MNEFMSEGGMSTPCLQLVSQYCNQYNLILLLINTDAPPLKRHSLFALHRMYVRSIERVFVSLFLDTSNPNKQCQHLSIAGNVCTWSAMQVIKRRAASSVNSTANHPKTNWNLNEAYQKNLHFLIVAYTKGYYCDVFQLFTSTDEDA